MVVCEDKFENLSLAPQVYEQHFPVRAVLHNIHNLKAQ